jgi:hypothetical protein
MTTYKLFSVTLLFFISNSALANGQYACMEGMSSGLVWENGVWKTSQFDKNNFILTVRNNQTEIEQKFVGKDTSTKFKCDRTKVLTFDFLNCVSRSAAHITFDENTLSGAHSRLLGSVASIDKFRDTLSVNTFTCQKFQ